MVFKADRARFDLLLHKSALARQLLARVLRRPLERRVPLRHKTGHGHVDRRAFAVAAADRSGAFGQIDDAPQVVVGFRGQPHHEVELDLLPAVLERRVQRRVEIGFGHALVDYVAHALRPGLGRQRQTALFHHFQPRRQADGKIVHAQARQTDFDPVVVKVRQRLEQRSDLRIIAAGQRDQAALFPARLTDQRADALVDDFRTALADGPVDHARLTETAAARTAAEQLHRHAVVDDARSGDDHALRRDCVHVAADQALSRQRELRCKMRARLVVSTRRQRGHIRAVKLGRGAQPLDPRPSFRLFQQIEQRRVDDLAVAEAENIDKIGHRFRHQRRRSAGHDDRISVRPA